MKTIKILLLFLCLCFSKHSIISQTNEGINYKAIIKDDIGNIITNQSIQIEFTVVYGISQSIAYHEMQSTTTDSNGLINVVIGDGELIDDADFETIGEVQWQFDIHYLNVKIDLGDGFIDFGTVLFGAVPYALHSKFADNAFSGNYNDLNNRPTIINPTGLELINENGINGFRLVGTNPNNYGNIGGNAIDISRSNSNSTSLGATGFNSFASGLNTEASGSSSTAMGEGTKAQNSSSFAIGSEATATAFASVAMGQSTIASGDASVAIGEFTEATNLSSVALGYLSVASGSRSTSIGAVSTASGLRSVAIGAGNTASGSRSTSLGVESTASGSRSATLGLGSNSPSYSELSVGLYNTNYTPNSTTNWDKDDRLFTVGNGSSDATRSDALIVLKDGTTTFNNVFNDNPDIILGGKSNTNDKGIISSDPNYTRSDITVRSNDNIVMELDKDNNDTSEFQIINSTNSSVFEVDESGNVFVNGVLEHSSDIRLKKDVEDLSYGLEEVLKLQPKSYNWKNRRNNKKSLGLIAQEVQPIISEIVNSQNNDQKTLSVSYTELIPVLINAIKQQQKIIEQQQGLLQLEKNTNTKQSLQYEALLKRVEAIEIGRSR